MDLIDTLIDLRFGHRREMGVHGSCGRRGVTEIGLDDAQIDARFQQMRGVRMAQGMDRGSFVYAALTERCSKRFLYGAFINSLQPVSSRKQPGGIAMSKPMLT